MCLSFFSFEHEKGNPRHKARIPRFQDCVLRYFFDPAFMPSMKACHESAISLGSE